MAFVPVPKDLNRVKTKVMFNLTKRQLVCFALAAAVGVPIFFLTKPSIGLTTDKVRPYRTDNLYAVIQREIKEKEELQIDRKQQKGGKA